MPFFAHTPLRVRETCVPSYAPCGCRAGFRPGVTPFHTPSCLVFLPLPSAFRFSLSTPGTVPHYGSEQEVWHEECATLAPETAVRALRGLPHRAFSRFSCHATRIRRIRGLCGTARCHATEKRSYSRLCGTVFDRYRATQARITRNGRCVAHDRTTQRSGTACVALGRGKQSGGTSTMPQDMRKSPTENGYGQRDGRWCRPIR